MIAIKGYEITDEIYFGPHIRVCRGRRKSDNRPVIIKTHADDFPASFQIKRYLHDFTIGKKFSDKNIVKYLDLIPCENGKAIVEEDYGAESLESYITQKKVGLEELLKISIQLASGLETIHRNNIIHKNIKPGNILINPVTIDVKITDFSIATQIQREIQPTVDPEKIEGTLAYISPEQTGRINRSLDYRTDFYTLGVSLYKLFTGRLPFESDDAMEMIHSHIAKIPVTPHAIDADIPEPVSGIIMKLLSKSTEDRYQSARGLKADLEECSMQMRETGHLEDFDLGLKDISEKFIIPERLYGRKQEINILMRTFDLAGQGQVELLMVSGYSGVGKSVLVHEIHKPVTLRKGYFVSGKFDQLNRNIAYSAIAQALKGLIRQIFGETDQKVRIWKERLLSALGPNGQIIIDVIPEVGLIIGKQPPVQDLGPTETQNRFQLVFLNFVKVFAQKEHPLVIFLDDLQWADSASLNLIKLMTVDEAANHLLIIGAYRDNEVDSSHPTMMTIEEIQKAGTTIHHITLSPLNISNVSRLIADTLFCQPQKSKPLAELIYKKTGGNPFFVKAFLQSLYDEEVLTFTYPQSKPAVKTSEDWWQWNMEGIIKMQATTNVAELFVKKIDQLSELTTETLKLASCLGNNFFLGTLSMILQKTQEETFLLIHPALNAGMLFQSNGNFHFIHDRVQEAAYSMITQDTQKEMHLHIGRQLLEHSTPEELEENIFDVVNHLNKGREHISGRDEKFKLAKLNLQAGKRAKESAAYHAALEYMSIGMELLPEDGWETHYELTFALHFARAENEFSVGNFKQTETILELLLNRAKSNLEKSSIYILQINQFSFVAKYTEAIAIGRKALSLLGMTFPKSDERLMPKVESLFDRIFRHLGDIKVESLMDMPEMKDSVTKAQIDILSALLPLTYYVDPGLLAYCAGSIVNLSVQHGNSPTSPTGYSFFAVLLAARESYEMGHQFGSLGLKLAEKYQIGPQIAMACHMFSTCINHWRKPLKFNLDIAQRGYKIGVESGDLQWSTYTRYPLSITSLYLGTNLEEFLEVVEKCHWIGEKNKNQIVSQVVKPLWQFALNLKGETIDKTTFNTANFDEVLFLEECKTTALMSIPWVHGLKLIALYLYGNYTEALEHSVKAEQFLQFCPGQLIIFDTYFYRALCQLAIYLDLPFENRAHCLDQIDSSRARIKIWAENCPENFQSQYLLVEGEKLRVLGKPVKAMELFEKAIESAKRHGFIHYEALGNELYAKFWLTLGRDKIAGMYMQEAHYLYGRWGASCKVRDLEEKYSKIISHPLTKKLKTIQEISTTISSRTETLDLMTVAKASQAISSNIKLEKLLSQMIKIIVENAGAQKGFLIRKAEEQAYIEAAATMDYDKAEISQPAPLDRSADLCRAIVNYVVRTGENVILHHAAREGEFAQDPYIRENEIKSVLCVPFQYKGKIYGALYLENNLVPRAFTEERVKLLQVLLAQAAISMENAELFERRVQAEEKWRALVESTTDWIWETDQNGVYTYASPKVKDLLGYEPEEIIGKTPFDLMPPDEAKRIGEIFQNLAEFRNPIVALENTNLHRNGRPVVLETNGLPILDQDGNLLGYRGIDRDITDSKRAEQALRESERKLGLHLQQTMFGVVQWDLESRVTEWNPAAENIFGYTKEEALGRHSASLIIPESALTHVDNVWNQLLKQTGGTYSTNENMTKDGRTIVCEWFNTAIATDDGTVIGVVSLVHDISDRKQAEEEKKKLEAQLQQAQKMESIGTLAGGIAHDFNNVLYSILGYTELTMDDVPEGSLAQRNLKEVFKGAMRAKDMVQQILAFSRKAETAKKPIKIQSVVKEATKLLRTSIPSTIEIRQNIDADCRPVLADSTQIHQVVMNLSTNAYQAMRDKGGLLELTLMEEEVGSYDSDLDLDFGTYLKLSVSDTGHGMDSVVKEKVFDPYFTTRGAGEGTGMGLAVVHGIVKSHGGNINVYSKLDEGTTFSVYFPLIETRPVEPKIISAEPAPTGTERILFVDDEEPIVFMGQQILERLGYQVTPRTSSVEALEVFRAKPDEFDLVITDMTMPNMTGLELASGLREIRPDIPIIICTGFSEMIDGDTAKSMGILGYVMKPITKEEIAGTIRQVLDEEKGK